MDKIDAKFLMSLFLPWKVTSRDKTKPYPDSLIPSRLLQSPNTNPHALRPRSVAPQSSHPQTIRPHFSDSAATGNSPQHLSPLP
nr:hypothetical protein Itr_chr07CG01190 [Ipomoea trifida]